MATSTHDMTRPGEAIDLYYYDGETSKKQAFPTTINTKYVQQFQNVNGGSSTFTIPPQNGISDVVLSFAYTNNTGSASGAIALPRGWGYALINRVSFRYGGSSQYFLSGQQVLQNALRAQTSRTSMDDILTLGGNVSGASELAAGLSVYANCVLTLPHNVPSGVGKNHPFPTDLLTQQVQITIELFNPASIFTNQTAAALPAWCSSLSQAQFQVAQIMLNNQGDALARRVDMSVNAYSYPAEFCQQLQTIPLLNSLGSQSVVLTGFRSGEVKSIQIWLTENGATAQSGVATATNLGYNPFLWQQPLSVTMSYAGEIYARFDRGVSQLWNLINNNKASSIDNVFVSGSAGAISVSSPLLSQWVELPFAQPLVDEDSHYTLVHGKPITNGIVNLDLSIPYVSSNTGGGTLSQAGWTLNVSYIYNTTLLFSQGTCDYIF
jgi:hypothetical protein